MITGNLSCGQGWHFRQASFATNCGLDANANTARLGQFPERNKAASVQGIV
jgi:hypothetical protein